MERFPVKVEPQLNFVQISDVHLRPTDGRSGWWLSERPEALLQMAVERVWTLGAVDFVVFTGDLFDKAEAAALDQFQAIVRELPCPYYVCVGNHDVVGKPWPGRLTKQTFAEKLGLPEKLFYSVAVKPGYRLVVLDTVPELFPHAQGRLMAEQMDWLRWQLLVHRDEKLVIAMHHPPVASPYFRDFRLNPNDGIQLAELIAASPNVVAVLSGHLHLPRRWSYRRRPYFSAPSLGGPPNAFRHFRLEVGADAAQLRYDWIAVLPEAERRPLWYPLSLGRRRDRRGRYRLRLPIFNRQLRRLNAAS
ncbi:metallophosphoesterase [Gloeobacter kilaueensis JS1]|uniref:Metallophosphoesterase n=1 Tax=Gloeobacter kilaueensis (strain ATCC BAA-2537 / CCAP 1431/1 / ULC 316 / JS1) TaxID=1183438 RepID=U5QQP0_GLOK1|nr:metallophosphoesterase [Gloeobacter kilaueensis JS1]